MGRRADLRLPGRRHQRLHGRLPRAGRITRVRPGPPRGDRVVRGHRAREVHRRGRGLHRHLRARRGPAPERALRREARPPAGGRDPGPAEARVARLGLAAGGRSARAARGRRRVRADVHGARAGPPPDRPRDAHRDLHPLGGVRDRAGGRAACGRRGARPRPRLGLLLGRDQPGADGAGGAGAPAGRGRAERGQQGGDPDRPGRQGRRAGAGRGRGRPRSCPTSSRSLPARSGCSGPSPRPT